VAHYFDIGIKVWLNFDKKFTPKFLLDNENLFIFKTHTNCRETLISYLFEMLTSLRNFVSYKELDAYTKHEICFDKGNKYTYGLAKYISRNSSCIVKEESSKIKIVGDDCFPPRLYSLITFLPHLVINTDYESASVEEILEDVLFKNCELMGKKMILNKGVNPASDEILTLFALSNFFERNKILPSYSVKVPDSNIAQFVARELVNSRGTLNDFISFIKKYNIKFTDRFYTNVYTDKRVTLGETLKEVHKDG